jgi:methyl-accepting chemotaxis protein
MATIAEFVGKIADWMAKNPELTATIIAVVVAIGILMGIFMALAPIITALVGLAGFFGVTLGAIAAPILIAIGVIALLIAIGVALWKNWDEISAGWVKGVDKINKSIENWAQGVKKRFNESIQSAKDMVAKIIQAFEDWKTGVSKRFNESVEDIKRIWNKVMKFFEDIDLKQIGKDIIQGLIDGIGSMANKVKEKAREIANGIGEKIKSILKLGSPSKLMISYGKFTGEGLAIGLENSLGMIKNMAEKMSKNAIPDIEMDIPKSKQVSAPAGKSMTVNIHSPKALDIREASREFNRTLNKMSLMW